MGVPIGKSRLGAGVLLTALLLACYIAMLSFAPSAYAAQLDNPITIAAADEAVQAEQVTVALTVVDEQEGRVIYNGKVSGLTTANTVADLLSTVGYHAVEAYAGDTKTYVEQYDSPYFVGKGYDAETGAYWVTVYDGSSDGYRDSLLSSALKQGGHYQYVYTSGSDQGTTFGYTDAIPDPLLVEASGATKLTNNLAHRFSRGGADSAIGNGTYDAAIGLGYLGLGGRIDISALKANAKQAVTAGAYAKYVLALNATGASTASYIKEMEAAETGQEDLYSTHLILAAYDQTGTVPSNAAKLTVDDLVKTMTEHQADNGQFPDSWPALQSTAQVIYALSSHAEDESVAAVLAKAYEAAVGAIEEDGTIKPNSWSQAIMDYDTMGEMIDALVAYGKATGTDVSAPVAKLIGALTAGADETLDGYAHDEGNGDEVMSSSAVLRGLAAARAAGIGGVFLDNEASAPVLVSSLSIGSLGSKAYAGAAYNPVPEVLQGGTALKAGVDFGVTYLNSSRKPIKPGAVKGAGTYYARVTGLGVYRGVVDTRFTISKAAIAKKMVGSVSNKKYNGKKYNPVPKVTFNGKVLKAGANTYKVSYLNKNKKAVKAANVKKVGTYYVKITGKGNFTGSAVKRFKIVKR